MRVLAFAILSFAGLGTAASAHPEGHDDEQYRAPIPARVDIPEAARQAVIRLVSQARLPASWAKARPAATSQRMRNGAQQWVVSFRNPAIRNRAQRSLFVVMRSDGSFVSANHRPT